MHWHIGYYENGFDIECVAYRRPDGTWDLFFDDCQDLGLFSPGHPRLDFGAFLFSTDENMAERRFRVWVESELLTFRTSTT